VHGRGCESAIGRTGKGLVDLEEIDIVHGDADALEEVRDGEGRAL
jgi:hypothetical protein